jgi:hypothetical protein
MAKGLPPLARGFLSKGIRRAVTVLDIKRHCQHPAVEDAVLCPVF